MSVQIHFHFFFSSPAKGHRSFYFFPQKFQEGNFLGTGSESIIRIWRVMDLRTGSLIGQSFPASSQKVSCLPLLNLWSYVTESTHSEIPGPFVLRTPSSSGVDVARLRSSDGFVNSWSNPDYKIRKWLYPWSCVMWSDPNLFFSADCKIYCPWHLTNWLPRNIIIITIYRKYYRSKHINSN